MQRADNRKYHYIYKITRDDGRFYIGLHSTDDLEDDYFGSGTKIKRSIKKHGIGKHSKEILEFLPSRKELKFREREIITEDMRADINCMNIAPGGGGGFKDEEHKMKCSSAGGRKGGKISGPENARRLHTKEIHSKIQVTKKINNSFFTRGMLGKNHSEETKKKMSGEKNSQFGTCWVTNGVKPIKIKKEQLDEYLSKGYSRGRIYKLLVSVPYKYNL